MKKFIFIWVLVMLLSINLVLAGGLGYLNLSDGLVEDFVSPVVDWGFSFSFGDYYNTTLNGYWYLCHAKYKGLDVPLTYYTNESCSVEKFLEWKDTLMLSRMVFTINDVNLYTLNHTICCDGHTKGFESIGELNRVQGGKNG